MTATRSEPRPDATGIFRPSRNPVAAIVVTAVAAVAIPVLGLLIRSHPFDLPIVIALNDVHTGVWGRLADGIYRVLEPATAVGLTVLIAVLVWGVSRSLRTAVAFGATVAATWLPVALFKAIVARPRPAASALGHVFSPAQADGSFPSGHTAFVTSLAIAVWFLVRDARWAPLAATGGIVAVALIALTVTSDGLHYPSDVLASIVWASAMAPTAQLIVVDVGIRRLWTRRRVQEPRGIAR